MSDEITALIDVASRLEAAGIDHMLTGSMALNLYAMPRMTRDVDLVAAVLLKDAVRIEDIFPPDEYYVSIEAARDAVLHQSAFNVIHHASMTKVDIMIRKQGEYRLVEFERRSQVQVRGHGLWVVSKEDLILSKLDWARDSLSERQLDDVKNLLATGCDEAYLHAWAAKLNLTAILTQVMA